MSDALDPATATQLIEHARQELLVRQQELTLHLKQDDTHRVEIEHGAAYALAQLAAQERDLIDNRAQYNALLRWRYLFVLGVLLVLAVFAGFAITHDAKDMVVEIFKLSLAFAAGGFGGYHFGKSRAAGGTSAD